MISGIVFRKTNKYWVDDLKPIFTVITSVHNRRDLILRAMNSVRNQTFKDKEYIIIDNASTEYIDDIIENFMNEVEFPMMYIKRDFGPGPHTGWNTGYLNARGTYICTIDSDDELVPDAIETFMKAWESIPRDKIQNYYDVVAHCVTEKGEPYGDDFPDNINSLPRKQALDIMKSCCGEHIHSRRVSILKKRHFPEPESVTYVSENNLWDQLHKDYKSLFINARLRVYHLDSTDSLNNSELATKTYTPQHFINSMWQKKYRMLNPSLFEDTIYRKLRDSVKYNICRIILNKLKIEVDTDWSSTKIKDFTYRFFILTTYIPSLFFASSYYKKIKV